MSEVPHFTAEDVAFLTLAHKDYGMFADNLPANMDDAERKVLRRKFLDRQFRAESLLKRVWKCVTTEHGQPEDTPIPGYRGAA